MKGRNILHFFDNLTSVPDLTGYEEYIDTLKPFEGSKWDRSDEPLTCLKKHIRTQLECFQKKRCAYCGLEYIWATYTHIEHITPEKNNPQFMFEPYNLVGSCPRCNGFEKKGTKETIAVIDVDYKKCTFIIVHPYLDNPKDHFKFVNTEKGIVIQYITQKAVKSGEIFGLNDPEMVEQRAKLFVSVHTTDRERYAQIEKITTTKKV